MKTPATTNKKIELINRTRNVLRGEWKNSAELKKLYKELIEWDQFAYATDVLLSKIKQDQNDGMPDSLDEHQKLAKFIYKDHSLPSSFKFDRALQELNTFDDLSKTENCETLGLAGAIHKYKWLYDHQHKNLELSIHYYSRGFASWKNYLKHPLSERTAWEREGRNDLLNDFGYTAINYAYMVELQAIDKLEVLGRTIDVSSIVKMKIDEANSIREFILEQFVDTESKQLNRNDYDSWVVATVAEAYFGLRNYTSALNFIQQYKQREREEAKQANPEMEVDDKILAWKIRTFSRQIFSLAYLQQMQLRWIKKADHDKEIQSQSTQFAMAIDEVKMTECLQALTGDSSGSHSEVEIKKEGKVGLALSGGGFRASLFHIGVLAALAERDKLCDVEVISCVSGGSILGAYYYLELKKELEQNEEVDYVKIIQNVESEFLLGIQKNLRMRVLSNLWCNMRMIFNKKYSRTHRLGELYEEHLYSRVNPSSKGPVYMSDLIIKPKDKPDGFNISTDNNNRKHKVPQLILNATTVNTGHNWQFSATWMGEPPGSIQTDIDVKPRLRRMYYNDAPEEYQKIRLGHAVGASSCVPVLFTPMPFHDLYPDDPNKEKIELQLIDGGLHDNQGIGSLIEQECKNIIISDASGQMSTTSEGANNELSVFFRSDSILQERLRELQFRDIKERAYSTQLNSLMALHLKSDLQKTPISWLNCTDPPRTIYNDAWCEDPNELTDYGILRSVQQLLSEIRTDLDSFNDVESWALMYSGYQQTHYELDKALEKQQDKSAVAGEYKQLEKRTDWKFLQIKDYVTTPVNAKEVEKILSTAKNVPFKLVGLYPAIKYSVLGIAFLGLAYFFYWGISNYSSCITIPIPISTIVWSVFLVVLGFFVSKSLVMVFNYKSTSRKLLIKVGFMIVISVVCNFYLMFGNGLYNRVGRSLFKK